MLSTPPGPERLFDFSLDCMSASRRGVDFGGELGSATVSAGASGAEREATKDLKSSSNMEDYDVNIMNGVHFGERKIRTVLNRSLPSILLSSSRYFLVRSKFDHNLILVPYALDESRVQRNQARMNLAHLAYP